MGYNTEGYYPDIIEAGSLSALLQHLFDSMGAGVKVAMVYAPEGGARSPMYYSHVESTDRSSTIMVAAKHRGFHVDFWDRGVCYGGSWHEELEPVARALVDFHEVARDLSDFEARNGRDWFDPDRAEAHQQGPAAYVRAQWDAVGRSCSDDPALTELHAKAARREALCHLLPFRSMYRLSFSFTTGYPFDDLGLFVMGFGGEFLVKDREDRIVARFSSADDALDLLGSHVATDHRFARHGTAGEARLGVQDGGQIG